MRLAPGLAASLAFFALVLPASGQAAAPPSQPAGWASGPLHLGTGFRHEGGSVRVRALQQALARSGFEPGPVDGLFGPLTLSAVERFQAATGLAVDGVVGRATRAALRIRASSEPQTAQRSRAPAAVRPYRARAAGAGSPVPAARPASHGSPVLSMVLVVVIACAVLLVATALMRRPRRKPSERRRSEPDARPRAVGYMCGDEQRDADAISQACGRRGWVLSELVREAPIGHRPGLAYALERARHSQAPRLVVSRVEHVAESPADLRALLDTLDRHGTRLVAVEPALDTTTPEGRRAAAAALARAARPNGKREGRTRAARGGGRRRGDQRLSLAGPLGGRAP